MALSESRDFAAGEGVVQVIGIHVFKGAEWLFQMRTQEKSFRVWMI